MQKSTKAFHLILISLFVGALFPFLPWSSLEIMVVEDPAFPGRKTNLPFWKEKPLDDGWNCTLADANWASSKSQITHRVIRFLGWGLYICQMLIWGIFWKIHWSNKLTGRNRSQAVIVSVLLIPGQILLLLIFGWVPDCLFGLGTIKSVGLYWPTTFIPILSIGYGIWAIASPFRTKHG